MWMNERLGFLWICMETQGGKPTCMWFNVHKSGGQSALLLMAVCLPEKALSFPAPAADRLLPQSFQPQ